MTWIENFLGLWTGQIYEGAILDLEGLLLPVLIQCTSEVFSRDWSILLYIP